VVKVNCFPSEQSKDNKKMIESAKSSAYSVHSAGCKAQAESFLPNTVAIFFTAGFIGTGNSIMPAEIISTWRDSAFAFVIA